MSLGRISIKAHKKSPAPKYTPLPSLSSALGVCRAGSRRCAHLHTWGSFIETLRKLPIPVMFQMFAC